MSLTQDTGLPRVLLIDDDPAFVRILELVLQTKAQLQILHDPHLALSTAISFQPDLIVCDMSMPGMSGVDVFRQLRDEVRTERLQFALITGYIDEDDGPVKAARAAGIESIISKDQDLGDLVGSVTALLSAS